jgi:hypothetical protein
VRRNHRTRHPAAMPGWGPAPGWGQPLPGWSPLIDHHPLPLRAASSVARWWWPILALASFGAVTGFVLGHDHPAPGLSIQGLLLGRPRTMSCGARRFSTTRSLAAPPLSSSRSRRGRRPWTLSSPVHRGRDGHRGPTEAVRLVSRLCNSPIPAESPDGRPDGVRRRRDEVLPRANFSETASWTPSQPIWPAAGQRRAAGPSSMRQDSPFKRSGPRLT